MNTALVHLPRGCVRFLCALTTPVYTNVLSCILRTTTSVYTNISPCTLGAQPCSACATLYCPRSTASAWAPTLRTGTSVPGPPWKLSWEPDTCTAFVAYMTCIYDLLVCPQASAALCTLPHQAVNQTACMGLPLSAPGRRYPSVHAISPFQVPSLVGTFPHVRFKYLC